MSPLAERYIVVTDTAEMAQSWASFRGLRGDQRVFVSTQHLYGCPLSLARRPGDEIVLLDGWERGLCASEVAWALKAKGFPDAMAEIVGRVNRGVGERRIAAEDG